MMMGARFLSLEGYGITSVSDDDGSATSCSQYSTCAPCLDYYGDSEDGNCLWCNIPSDGGGPICVTREEASEQCQSGQAQAVIRSSLVNNSGTPWRCPVCGFDNRPLCKNCDLCGVSSGFAEAYWISKSKARDKGGRGKRASSRVEESKTSAKSRSLVAGAGASGGEATDRAQGGDEMVEDGKEGVERMRTRAKRDGDGEESESDSESSPLLRGSALIPQETAKPRSSQGGESAVDMLSESEAGASERGAGGVLVAGDASEKARLIALRLPYSVTLTERQKRARRRRIWQRVLAADGKVRWKFSLESPASSIPRPPSVPPVSGGAGYSLSTSQHQPQPSPTPPVPGSTVSSATAVLRFWSSSRSRSPPQVPATGDRESPSLALENNEGTDAEAASLHAASGGDRPSDGMAEAKVEVSLSDVERGDGRFSPTASRAGQGQGRAGASLMRSRMESPSSLTGDMEEGTVEGGNEAEKDSKGYTSVVSVSSEVLGRNEEWKVRRSDSFGDDGMRMRCPAYYVTFLDAGGLAWDEAHDGELVMRQHTPPPSSKQVGPSSAEGISSDADGFGTGPSARRGGWIDAAVRRREARREEAASEEWVNSTRADVVKLCEIAALPFWQKHSWFLDQLRLLQVPHGAGMEAMRIEVHRKNLLEDSFAQVSAMNTGELRRWLRVQFVGEPGVDAGGLEREWFLLVCRALFDPSTGLFMPQSSNGAFAINPSSGVANEMHLEYFRFTGRVFGKLLMEHGVAPYSLSLPILKHVLGLPLAFSDLAFADAELHRNLGWLRTHQGVGALGLDFTVTYESFGVKEVAELVPGGKDMNVTDSNKEEFLKLRLKHHVLGAIHEQLWNFMRGLYDVVPSHLISVFDHQELELLLCGIPEIDVAEWKRHSRYLGEYRRDGEEHQVIKLKGVLLDPYLFQRPTWPEAAGDGPDGADGLEVKVEAQTRRAPSGPGQTCAAPRWFWEVLEDFSEEDKARFLQFCTGTCRLPPHGFKALQSITKRESAFPRAHTCFNKLDLPIYESRKELEECIRLCICFELTGFTID